MRCPHGKKTKLYKRAKVEKFAHYLMPDGLITRLSIYDDKDCKLHNFYVTVYFLSLVVAEFQSLWNFKNIFSMRYVEFSL